MVNVSPSWHFRTEQQNHPVWYENEKPSDPQFSQSGKYQLTKAHVALVPRKDWEKPENYFKYEHAGSCRFVEGELICVTDLALRHESELKVSGDTTSVILCFLVLFFFCCCFVFSCDCLTISSWFFFLCILFCLKGKCVWVDWVWNKEHFCTCAVGMTPT